MVDLEPAHYAVLVPLKSTVRGKSRLGLPTHRRVALARAMARDALHAMLGCEDIAVVHVLLENTDDTTILDPSDRLVSHICSTDGLNASLREGARLLTDAGWTGPVAALPADLPFLRSDDLSAALRQAAGRSAVVADAEGSGTTLLTAPSPAALRPAYGPDSFRRHRELGAVPLRLGPSNSVQFDVDHESELTSVAAPLRLGPATSTLLAGWSAAESTQVTVLP